MRKILSGILAVVIVGGTMFTGCKNDKEERFKYDSSVVNLEELREDIDKNLIIFAGESHGFKKNSEVKKEFIKFINENGGFKYLLTEFSPADGYIVNDYLKTGDKALLDEMYKNLKGTMSWTKEGYEFYEWLYEYNNTLKEEEKIICVGSDIVHQSNTGLKVLKKILRNKEAEASISNQVESILNLNAKDAQYREELRKLSKGICEEIEKDEKKFKEYYGDDFLDVYTILTAMHLGINSYNNRGNSFDVFTKYRDSAMYEIFDIYYRNLESGRFFGQWGDAHTYTENPTGVQWFGAYLNDDDRFKGKIISIQLMYDNSEIMHRGSGGKYYSANFDNFNENREIFSTEMSESSRLYKLDREGSIFTKERALMFNIYRAPSKGVTTDYIQGFIRLDGSKATEPLH